MLAFDLGELHPAIIHIPIALIIGTLIFDFLFWVTKREIFQTIAGWSIIVAAITLVPTAFTGFLAKEFYAADDPDVLRHQYMAIATALFTISYAIFRGYVFATQRIYSIYLFLLLSLLNVVLVSITAEFGGSVVRGEGIIINSSRPEGYVLPYGKVKHSEKKFTL